MHFKVDNKSVSTSSSKLAEVMEAIKGLPVEELSVVMEELQHVLSGPIPEGEYLTIAEVSAYLKISRASIWRRSKDRILKPYKMGNRTLFARADIDDYLKNGMNHEEH